jgi:hypothetical protein
MKGLGRERPQRKGSRIEKQPLYLYYWSTLIIVRVSWPSLERKPILDAMKINLYS